MPKYTLCIVDGDGEIDGIKFEENHTLDLVREKLKNHLSSSEKYISLGFHNISLRHIHNVAVDVTIVEGWQEDYSNVGADDGTE